MDRKEAFDIVIAKLDEDKREEVVDKLREVDTRVEKLAILESYGISIKGPEDILGEDWEDECVELTDEDLDNVAGGIDSWSVEGNCEP
jgi:hypothetical protein